MIDFTATTSVNAGGGLWSAVWLWSQNCLLPWKVGAFNDNSGCDSYPASTYAEIDLGEWQGSTSINQQMFQGEGTSGHDDRLPEDRADSGLDLPLRRDVDRRLHRLVDANNVALTFGSAFTGSVVVVAE